MVLKRSITTAKRVALAAAVVFSLAQCAEEEVIPSTDHSTTETRVESSSTGQTAAKTGSLTISGIFTSYASTAVDCKTCTFVVPNNLQVVDGKALGIKPGAVICLDALKAYSDLSFENLEGTEQNPIIIATSVITQVTGK